MARVVWAEPALQDLEQIADYIALDKPKAAKDLVRTVFEKVELLETFPDMCPVPKDLPDYRYKHLIVGPLRIFHRVEADIVYVVYVMRTERELKIVNIEERDRI